MNTERSSETWRVFCAINLPEPVRQLVAGQISELRRLVPEAQASWSRPENIHLTLKFFGELPLAEVENVTIAARRAVDGLAPFEIQVGDTGIFPSHGSPRVLWLGVDDFTGRLAQLHARARRRISIMGISDRNTPLQATPDPREIAANGPSKKSTRSGCSGFAPTGCGSRSNYI